MPVLIPTNKYLEDLESYRRDPVLRKKVPKAMAFLEDNPLHPDLHLERITNDPTAWSVRIDQRYRLSLEPRGYLPAGNPDWSAPVVLLRILDHDDLYRHPR
jgi:hypothetical protein